MALWSTQQTCLQSCNITPRSNKHGTPFHERSQQLHIKLNWKCKSSTGDYSIAFHNMTFSVCLFTILVLNINVIKYIKLQHLFIYLFSNSFVRIMYPHISFFFKTKIWGDVNSRLSSSERLFTFFLCSSIWVTREGSDAGMEPLLLLGQLPLSLAQVSYTVDSPAAPSWGYCRWSLQDGCQMLLLLLEINCEW